MQKRAGLLLVAGVSIAATAAAAMTPHVASDATARAAWLPIAALLQTGLQGQTSAELARPAPAIAVDIARWNSLRQSDSLPFTSYASFLIGHRGWPGEAAMRRTAERQADPSVANPGEIVRFFTVFPPLTNTGHARYAFALMATGRRDDARREALAAWTGGVLTLPDEQRILGAFGPTFSQADQELDRSWREINDAVVEFAREQGFDLIVPSPVVYASTRVDITDQVLERLKKQYRAKNGGEP